MQVLQSAKAVSCGRDKGHSREHAQQGRPLHRWMAAVPAQDHTRSLTICGASLLPSGSPNEWTDASPTQEPSGHAKVMLTSAPAARGKPTLNLLGYTAPPRCDEAQTPCTMEAAGPPIGLMRG